jgi:hypothetical protein
MGILTYTIGTGLLQVMDLATGTRENARPCSCFSWSWRAGATIADIVQRAGVVQDALHGGGLAHVDVGHDPNVAVHCDTTFVFWRMGKVRGMRSKEASLTPRRCWGHHWVVSSASPSSSAV